MTTAHPCWVTGCTGDVAVQWSRRLTDGEFEAFLTAEREQREMAALLADPQKPAPEFVPLPTADDTVTAVFACPAHAIHIDDAARVHTADCQAPDPTALPACGCTPEPDPEPAPPAQATVTLPTGWIITHPIPQGRP